jgi:hypothetical protein
VLITVLLDNDISGHQELFIGTVYSTGWAEYHLVRLITLIEVGLTNDALDRDIWQYCQSHSFLLLTTNRNQDDPHSLEQTLRDENREDALPVVTISDPQRLIEPAYRERCIHALIGIILDLNNYLGSVRLFIP